MGREHWVETMTAVSAVAGRWVEARNYEHPTAVVMKVYLWAAHNDRPVVWACDPDNWSHGPRPAALPSQPTMSRRVRGDDFRAFMQAVGRELNGRRPAGRMRLRKVDGPRRARSSRKPLQVAAHSTDRQATWGRGQGQKAKGYKLHSITSGRPMPDSFRVTPLNVSEKEMARRMARELDGYGYLLGDTNYDDSSLHEVAAAADHQLVTPRQHPDADLGHRRHSSHRIRAIKMLEIKPEYGGSRFGRDLFKARRDIERDFGNLVAHGGGLTCLPPWVRRPWRVRPWVHAKLLLNAARICLIHRRRQKSNDTRE